MTVHEAIEKLTELRDRSDGGYLGDLPLHLPDGSPATAFSVCPSGFVHVLGADDEAIISASDEWWRFQTFWDAYPRRHERQRTRRAALNAWYALHPDAALLEVMLAAVARQRRTERWRRGIIPSPARWLRGRSWEDVPSPDDALTPIRV
jgi:hypothetical protein